MTREEFRAGPKHLLVTGWMIGDGSTLDDGAWAFLLDKFTVDEVNEAIRGKLGQPKAPKATDIATAIMAKRGAALHNSAALPLASASEEILAKRAWMDELDRRETERRDKELEEWATAHPKKMADGRAWLVAHGFNVPDFMEEVFD